MSRPGPKTSRPPGPESTATRSLRELQQQETNAEMEQKARRPILESDIGAFRLMGNSGPNAPWAPNFGK